MLFNFKQCCFTIECESIYSHDRVIAICFIATKITYTYLQYKILRTGNFRKGIIAFIGERELL